MVDWVCGCDQVCMGEEWYVNWWYNKRYIIVWERIKEKGHKGSGNNEKTAT
jgi:hypothetical protein